jgi:hypothetical protein
MLFKDYLETRVRAYELNLKLPYFFNEKIATFEYCKNNNINVVEILNIFDTPEDLNLDNLPNEFVLKPNFLYSAKGVMVLKKIDNDEYYDEFTKTTYTLEKIKEYQRKYFDQGNAKNKKIILEEKIKDKYIDGIPCDYKVYIFYDKVALIAVFDRNDKEQLYIDWYDGEFNKITDDYIKNNAPYVKNNIKDIAVLNTKEIIDFSIEVSKKINLPFVSLDLYNTDQGIKLGEVTLAPGGLYYGVMFKVSERAQLELGQLWTDALSKIETNV